MSTNAIKVNNPMKVITGPDTRWSYANVWEPKSINGGAAKYSVSLIIPKSDTVTVAKIKAAIEAAYQEGQAKLKGNGRSVPPLAAIKTPLRDGDVERPDDPAYANAYFINANSATAPGIVDADRNPVLTRSEVYSGVYGRASINFYSFNSNGNKGNYGAHYNKGANNNGRHNNGVRNKSDIKRLHGSRRKGSRISRIRAGSERSGISHIVAIHKKVSHSVCSFR